MSMSAQRLREIRRAFARATAELEEAHDQAILGQNPRLNLAAARRHIQSLSRALRTIDRHMNKIQRLVAGK